MSQPLDSRFLQICVYNTSQYPFMEADEEPGCIGMMAHFPKASDWVQFHNNLWHARNNEYSEMLALAGNNYRMIPNDPTILTRKRVFLISQAALREAFFKAIGILENEIRNGTKGAVTIKLSSDQYRRLCDRVVHIALDRFLESPSSLFYINDPFCKMLRVTEDDTNQALQAIVQIDKRLIRKLMNVFFKTTADGLYSFWEKIAVADDSFRLEIEDNERVIRVNKITSLIGNIAHICGHLIKKHPKHGPEGVQVLLPAELAEFQNQHITWSEFANVTEILQNLINKSTIPILFLADLKKLKDEQQRINQLINEIMQKEMTLKDKIVMHLNFYPIQKRIEHCLSNFYEQFNTKEAASENFDQNLLVQLEYIIKKYALHLIHQIQKLKDLIVIENPESKVLKKYILSDSGTKTLEKLCGNDPEYDKMRACLLGVINRAIMDVLLIEHDESYDKQFKESVYEEANKLLRACIKVINAHFTYDYHYPLHGTYSPFFCLKPL